MKRVKTLTLCLLLTVAVLGAQSFGFGGTLVLSAAQNALQGLKFDIPSKGVLDAQVVVMADIDENQTFNVGFKINRDMGEVYNIKRYVGFGIGVSKNYLNDVGAGGQGHVGIKIPGFAPGYWFDLEVGFSLNSTKLGKLSGGAFVGAGSSYSF